MTFEQFKTVVLDGVGNYLPDSFKVQSIQLNTVTKTNGVTLTGLTIVKAGSNLTPNIYLENFYEMLQQGSTLGEVISKIVKCRLDNDANDNFEVGSILNLDACKSKILPRLLGASWNEKVLQERPHKLIADLAVTFVVQVRRDESGIASAPVTHTLANTWGISVDELYDIAMANLKADGVGKLQTMTEIMTEMVMPLIKATCGDDEDMAAAMLAQMVPEVNTMFVLSNEDRLNGVSLLLNDDAMRSVAKTVGSKFLILPSSIHECIIVPEGTLDHMSVSDLKAMVCEVNQQEVDEQERLSDSVYKWSEETGLVVAE